MCLEKVTKIYKFNRNKKLATSKKPVVVYKIVYKDELGNFRGAFLSQLLDYTVQTRRNIEIRGRTKPTAGYPVGFHCFLTKRAAIWYTKNSFINMISSSPRNNLCYTIKKFNAWNLLAEGTQWGKRIGVYGYIQLIKD